MPNRYTYRLVYAAFFVSVLCSFFYLRPLNSPWHRFIAGDGLGYYAYLPATFIYGDKNYTYNWFNEVFKAEYSVIATAPGLEHFTTEYKNRRINKYYPGLSLLWLPFFAIAHLCAFVFQFPANGYSLPYQWSIGAASLFYLFLGLYYLRKLLFRFYGKAWLACLLPVFIFYGTQLFEYAISMNSLSHLYSFTLITAFVYYLHRFFNDEENRIRFLFVSLFLFLFIVLIRPMNVLVLCLVPALVPDGFRMRDNFSYKFNLSSFIWLFLSLALLFLQWFMIKKSTGEFFPNTYAGEPFYFSDPMILKALVGFQYGLFVYAPLLLFSLTGVVAGGAMRRSYFLLLCYLLFLYLYASWWFWPITARATVDVLVLPALLLGGWFNRFSIRNRAGRILFFFCVLLTFYYQLKSYQFRNGILDRNYTHAALYFKHFFKVKPGLVYAIPPGSILKQTIQREGFEVETYTGNSSADKCLEGFRSAKLDVTNQYSKEIEALWPDFMKEDGLAKMRLSFWLYAEESMQECQVYANLVDHAGNSIRLLPFYIKKKEMGKEYWSYIELGQEFGPEELKNNRRIAKVKVFFWNSAKTNSLYVDDFRMEFFLCDRSAEIVP